MEHTANLIAIYFIGGLFGIAVQWIVIYTAIKAALHKSEDVYNGVHPNWDTQTPPRDY